MSIFGRVIPEIIIISNILLSPAARSVELISFDQSGALGGAIAPIASSVGRSEAPKALSESHRSLSQKNPATARGFKGDF